MEANEQYDSRRDTKRIIWGAFLIALGALFLLGHFGWLGWMGLHSWWPLIFVVLGITRLVERRIGGALTMFLLGGWFLACENNWMGFTYGNSWGLILVAVGVGIVVKALTGEHGRCWGPAGGRS